MGTVSPTTEPLSTMMRVFFLLFILVPTSLAMKCTPFMPADLEEFLAMVKKSPINDPVEKEKHQKTLDKHILEIERQNKMFSEGNSTWLDCLYDSADLSVDEFIKQKTGLLLPEPDHQVDERSEQFFDKHRYSRASVPDSYSSVDQEHVSPVKDQLQCGSCVAFATMATVETCFKKITGVFGDYSEQQMVDCGYNGEDALACNG